MTPHPGLSIDQIGMCGAARIPLPPRQAERSLSRTSGDTLYDLNDPANHDPALPAARWRFTVAAKQARGDKPVYLFCYGRHPRGGHAPVGGDERAAVIAAIEALP